jgi:hypothetical protein
MTAPAPGGSPAAWPLPLQSGLAAALAFAVLAMLCETLAPNMPEHTPIHTADTGAMALLAPLVWALQLFGLMVFAMPAAALGALLGRLASAGLRLPVLSALALPAGLLLGALYGRLVGPSSALASPLAAMIVGLGATAAALLVVVMPHTPLRGRR